jgi:hypothetical protein
LYAGVTNVELYEFDMAINLDTLGIEAGTSLVGLRLLVLCTNISSEENNFNLSSLHRCIEENTSFPTVLVSQNGKIRVIFTGADFNLTSLIYSHKKLRFDPFYFFARHKLQLVDTSPQQANQ